jgi:hypothetical protein
MGRLKRHRPSYAERLIKRPELAPAKAQPTRLVPSKRGLLTVFLAAAAAGAGAGLLALHLLHVCS